jgi:hypothetical protein
MPTVKVQYLEVVTKDVDAVCAAYSSAHNAKFGQPIAGLGNARTATLLTVPPMEIPGHGSFAIYLLGYLAAMITVFGSCSRLVARAEAV